MQPVRGLHHITAIAGPAQENLDFYAGVLGMRLVKRSINQDDPGTYHLFYADAEGHPGTDLTVITYGAVVPRALQAAQKLEREQGVSVELIDLRTLNPFDWETVAASVSKTNRVLVAHEDTLSWGYGAEIAARIADELFDRLDAPVRRVGALDTWVGYHPKLEAAILPQTEKLAAEMERLLAY